MRHQAIFNLYPNVVSINDIGITDINGNQVDIDESSVAVEITRLEAEYEAQQYARDRSIEYPSIGDQLDMIFKSGILDGSDWATTIQAIKDKYPKS